jgi:Zn-dependent M28 family amino/carboxypeptidase
VNHGMKRGAAVATATVVCASLALIGTPALAAIPVDTTGLTDAITQEGLQQHLDALQAAADANGGNRAAGTPGYQASSDYVVERMTDAGYDVVLQPFTYFQTFYEGSELERTAPTTESFVYGEDFTPMSYSVGGDVTEPVTAVDVNLADDLASTSGCEAADFAGFPAGNIALIQRGSCDFRLKALNAETAGATAVIIFNQGNDIPGDDRVGLLNGTLGSAGVGIPVVGTTFELGAAAAVTTGLEMRVSVVAEVVKTDTWNVIADLPGGREDRTVLAGAHLDSVHEGPGINDNGTGTAALIEIAEQIADLETAPRNHVRFAFWGGEEDGLLGSEFYVSQLTKTQTKQIAVNLNFDMLGSPNPVTFIYDGDGDAFGATGPNGSDIIEGVFEDYFTAQDEPFEATEFDGRSDYFAFINAGIPAGGLFSGAEGIMTPEQAALFDGAAGVPYDECYHQACDDIGNVDIVGLEKMADAAAHATLTFAETTSAVNGTAKGKATGQITWKFKGNQAIR